MIGGLPCSVSIAGKLEPKARVGIRLFCLLVLLLNPSPKAKFKDKATTETSSPGEGMEGTYTRATLVQKSHQKRANTFSLSLLTARAKRERVFGG